MTGAHGELPPVPDTLAPGARVHLVGIGGAGMSPLARILLERGHPVSGSDLRGGGAVDALAALGAEVHVGHAAEHVGAADLVVISSAVPADNPEVAAARMRGVPVLLRAQLLELVMAGSRRILIAGTHGKTTTTAMVATILERAGREPGYAIGGVLADRDAGARSGAGELFVAEADEAYRSFLHLTADCAVVTNIEMDHHDEYSDEVVLMEAFVGFLDRRTPGAPVILCWDDPGSRRLGAAVDGRLLTYGTADDADLRITGLQLASDGAVFGLRGPDFEVADLHLPQPGLHNVRNAAAAAAAAMWAGVEVEDIRAGIGSFAGTRRRFQRIGESRGVLVIDDYAHHPTEVRAVIGAARQARPGGRVLVAFQPHRWSRTAAFGTDLGRALAEADLALVTDVYAAGEAPVPGAGPDQIIGEGSAVGGRLRAVPDVDALPEALAEIAVSGDIVLLLGAGDITAQGPRVVAALEGGA